MAYKSGKYFLLLALLLPGIGLAQNRASAPTEQAVLWRDPVDIKSRALFYGAGGRNRQPQGKLTFLEEDTGGSNPKFQVEDERGIRWKIKLGDEAQPETAATRLVWAAGYFVDEVYYLPAVRIAQMPRLRRGQQFVAADGTVRGARLERDEKGDKKQGEWDWFDNPFNGTRELNGLRVLMALINNWDLKEENNAIRARQGVQRAYYVSDLGATFGRTGNNFTRTRNDVEDYRESNFIRRIEGQQVDFVFHSRPFFLLIFNPPYYCERTRMEQLAQDIPRADARWLGELLGRLAPAQLADAFRAAGYDPAQTAEYVQEVRGRIAELKSL
jgi:hypothetical protein